MELESNGRRTGCRSVLLLDGVMSFKFDRSHYSSGTQEWMGVRCRVHICIVVKDLIPTSREVIQYS